MKRPVPFFILVCLSLFFSCKKEDLTPHLPAIVGNYQWMNSTLTTPQWKNPATVEYFAATDSTDRYGISIKSDKRITCYKNQEMLFHGTVTGTMEVETGILVDYQPDLGSAKRFIIHDELLEGADFPFAPQASLVGGSMAQNVFKKIGNEPGLPFNYVPLCDTPCDVCGSYTGYYVILNTPSGDTVSYTPRTYHVSQNSVACSRYVTDATGQFVGYFGGSSYVWFGLGSDDRLYLSWYIHINYGTTKVLNAQFVGDKD